MIAYNVMNVQAPLSVIKKKKHVLLVNILAKHVTNQQQNVYSLAKEDLSGIKMTVSLTVQLNSLLLDMQMKSTQFAKKIKKTVCVENVFQHVSHVLELKMMHVLLVFQIIS